MEEGMSRSEDFETVRELTVKYRGRKVMCREYLGDDKYSDEFEAEISHFSSLRGISVIYDNRFIYVHDEKFRFID
jgi:hypothetical protein